jgi:hypothetical protein
LTAADPSPPTDGEDPRRRSSPDRSRQQQPRVIAMSRFENKIYKDADRLAILEHRAAELERLLLLVTNPDGDADANAAAPSAVPGGGGRRARATAGGRRR